MLLSLPPGTSFILILCSQHPWFAGWVGKLPLILEWNKGSSSLGYWYGRIGRAGNIAGES